VQIEVGLKMKKDISKMAIEKQLEILVIQEIQKCPVKF
jgi:hypothetical protein